MRKFLRKALAGAVTLAVAASYAVMPITASADDYAALVDGDTVLNEWKIYFGAEGTTPRGDYADYTLVTPARNYTESGDYGFIGTNEDDYKLAGARIDGFVQQEGQVITLEAGANGGIGSTGEDIYENAGDKYYPTRFSMKVTDDTYYRVKATVTTLDSSKSATASLYTERKHPLYTEKTISAGDTVETEFTVRVTPVYYQKSDPQGTIADGVLSVCVLGENTALLSLQIQQVETAPVLWVLGDSTVTDSGGDLPFFPLQNYTGVGTGLTKYLPSTIAMVNEGEGGLNAADSLHFSVVTSRLKEGDYLYVEYGHNHKDDKVAGYLSCIDKYYQACKKVGATLILVGPIDRVQASQYDSETNTWSQTLQGYATAAKAYVDLMLWSGEDAAAYYVSTYDNDDTSAAEEYLETELAKDKTSTITNVAFVDLNAPSLEWYAEQSASGVLNGLEVENNYLLTHFYFQTSKGGGADTTHPNDTGAENLAYLFYKNADTESYPALEPLLANFAEGATHEEPTLVSEDVTTGGLGGTAWPTYIVPTTEKYPVVINDIQFDEDGYAAYAKVTTQAAETELSTYGIIVITVYDEDGNEKGKIYAIDQVDNSTGYGTQEITNFTTDVTLGETDTYTAVVLQAADTDDGLAVVEDGTVYSAVYTPTDIETYLLMNEDSDGYEDFDYYGATYDGATDELSSYNGWTQIGSAVITSYLNEATDGTKYVELTSTGKKSAGGDGSFYYDRTLDTAIGTTGRYVISADMQFVSGGGLTYNLVTGHGSSSSQTLGGSEGIELFEVGESGVVTASGIEVGTVSATGFTNVKYVLDMDLATATVTVGGGDPVTIALDNYDTTSLDVSPSTITQFMFGGSKVAFDVKVANLTVAKLKDQKLPTYSATVKSLNEEMGTVSLTYETEETEEEVETQSLVSLAADEDPTITLEYKDAEATVPADKACTVTVISATYDDDGALESVTTTPLTFTEAGSQTVDVTEESKVTVWDSLEGMKPLTVVTEDSAIQSQTEELTINTVVTATATANDGYVFMGWYDGSTLVSSDAEYSFRLRGDTELKASFVKEAGVDDIASFSLSKDLSAIEAATGNQVTMSIEDAQDASGVPISSVTNSDASWSTDTTGITVVDGVVTVTEEYVPASFRDTVTVTATINGVSATASVKVYASEYYEDFSEITSVSEWITDSTSSSLGAILDTSSDTASFAGMTAAGSGKVLVLGSSVNGDNGTFAYNKSLGVSDQTKLYFGFDIEPYQIRSDGKTAAVTLQFVDSSDTAVFTISVNTSGGNSSFNGTAVSGFAAGTVVTVDTVLDFENSTMDYTLTNSAGKVLASGTAELTAANLDRMYFSGTWQYGKFAMDNVYIDYETTE
ncbi:MAG: hypothetical protein LUD03_02530 [Firmicutes bacterium]|nr:hypothetical protein [Bacillota bacterium]